MPGADDLMMRVYAAMAQKERELISERTRAALAAAKARGAVLGGDCGYRPPAGPCAARAAAVRGKRADTAAHRLWLEIAALKSDGITTLKVWRGHCPNAVCRRSMTKAFGHTPQCRDCSPELQSHVAELIPPDLTTLDRVALGWFLLAWLGYGQAIHAMPLWTGCITARLNDIRRAWMVSMLGRDNRITDASLLGHTVHSATFFASTTMVALAGLLGALGAFEHSFGALESLAFTVKTSRTLAEAKLLLLVLVFAHTFLKLSWALRQLNYCLAMIGAAPPKPDGPERYRIAEHLSALLSLAIRSFNAGIRGYQFALAALAWLLGPQAFLAATTGIVAMLIWRQFGSATAGAIGQSHGALVGSPVVWLKPEQGPAIVVRTGA